MRRRTFLTTSACAAASIALADGPNPDPGTRQATGVKVGEVTARSAIVWTRLTAYASHNARGRWIPRRQPLPQGVAIDDLKGACPGAAGRIRLRYGTRENLAGATTTEWVNVGPRTDFSHQFRLENLSPATEYFFAVETTGPGGRPEHRPLRGRFRTAPPADQYRDVTFTVVTGMAYRDLDHPEGFHIYPAMARLRPDFLVPTGDTVYYDNDGVLVQSIELARHHWHRMYGLPRLIDFHRRIPAYWEKDDHDCYHDDCWPGSRRRNMGNFTFEQGQRVFREQVPMGRLTYRTVRWGRGLQVWFVEGRDYRSPNTMPDGPDKTIWGREQKAWLFRTLRQSDAVFKVLVSPTPIVGPDRPNKRDNHANRAFQHEGDEIRRWFQRHLPERFVICCGDRHWQYHSVHPETRVQEFSCGPASDRHAGGSPGEDRRYHRFHRVRGGFLSVAYRRSGTQNRLILRLHDVHGEVVYEHAIRA